MSEGAPKLRSSAEHFCGSDFRYKCSAFQGLTEFEELTHNTKLALSTGCRDRAAALSLARTGGIHLSMQAEDGYQNLDILGSGRFGVVKKVMCVRSRKVSAYCEPPCPHYFSHFKLTGLIVVCLQSDPLSPRRNISRGC
jgi:hypothetical protein